MCIYETTKAKTTRWHTHIYIYIDKHTYTHTHTATVSSNIIEVWQWKANRKTHTKVYMLKQLLSLQKIGFLLRKWFEASPSFGYLTYTLTIRRYENTPKKFSLQTERKIFNFYYFPLSLSLSLSVRLIFEYCLLFSLQIKVFNSFRVKVEYLFAF